MTPTAPRALFAPAMSLKEVERYGGSGDPLVLHTFIRKMEGWFLVSQVQNDIDKIRCTSLRLVGPAFDWFLSQGAFSEWHDLAFALQRRFLPIGFQDDLRIRLNELCQRRGTVSSYVAAHTALLNVLQEPELRRDRGVLISFVTGLKPDIQTRIELHKIRDIDEAYSLALTVESQLKPRRMQGNLGRMVRPSTSWERQRYNYNTPTTEPMDVDSVEEENKKRLRNKNQRKCYLCGSTEHLRRACPKNGQDQRYRRN